MKIWNGKIKDMTDFATDEFLKVNSCGFQNITQPFTVVRENGRQDYHFLLITGGKGEAFHNGKKHPVSAGNLVIYEPNEKQQYLFEKNCTSLWCHFSGTAVEEIFKSVNIKGGVYFLRPDKNLTDTFSALIQKFNLKGNEKFALPCLLELIYKIGDELSKDKNEGNADSLLPALSYINANYNKHLSLKELAELSGYSMSRFSHLFSEITGTTPIRYQNSVRLKLASEMLLSTTLSVSSIAYALGFNDPLYFSRIFKKHYGIPPTKYKKSLI